MRYHAGTMFKPVLALTVAAFSISSYAADLPARNCEIFLKKVTTKPNSHGIADMEVLVKVGWIGDGETILRVGLYSSLSTQDLGNSAECHTSATPWGGSTWKNTDASPGESVGESTFRFPISTGSVGDRCRGYQGSTQASFFVQTNKNTYWLNPNLDSNQYFVFDRNGFDILQNRGGFSGLSTTRSDMKYYNPQNCQ